MLHHLVYLCSVFSFQLIILPLSLPPPSFLPLSFSLTTEWDQHDSGFLEVENAVTQASHPSSSFSSPSSAPYPSPSFSAATGKIYYHKDLLYNKQNNNSVAIKKFSGYNTAEFS